jgi:hypothetical protein
MFHCWEAPEVHLPACPLYRRSALQTTQRRRQHKNVRDRVKNTPPQPSSTQRARTALQSYARLLHVDGVQDALIADPAFGYKADLTANEWHAIPTVAHSGKLGGRPITRAVCVFSASRAASGDSDLLSGAQVNNDGWHSVVETVHSSAGSKPEKPPSLKLRHAGAV